MAEYIKCRNCESPDCKGCNLKRLETMLNNGKFDCIMNENRCINQFAYVAPVRHGWWIKNMVNGEEKAVCSKCRATNKQYEPPFCPHCGAIMDLEQFGKDELFQESKGENENERF